MSPSYSVASLLRIISGSPSSSSIKSNGTRVCAWGFDNLTPPLSAPLCYRVMDPASWRTAQETCHSLFSDILGVGSGYQGVQAITLPSLLCKTFNVSQSKLRILCASWGSRGRDKWKTQCQCIFMFPQDNLARVMVYKSLWDMAVVPGAELTNH